jgi:hypothetical protein
MHRILAELLYTYRLAICVRTPCVRMSVYVTRLEGGQCNQTMIVILSGSGILPCQLLCTTSYILIVTGFSFLEGTFFC